MYGGNTDTFSALPPPHLPLGSALHMEDANGCVPNVGDHTPIVVDLLSVYGNQYNCTSRNALQPIRSLILNYF